MPEYMFNKSNNNKIFTNMENRKKKPVGVGHEYLMTVKIKGIY